MRDVVTWVLVGAGVAFQVLVCLGVLLMRDALDRLHYVSASTLGVGFVAGTFVLTDTSMSR